MINYFYNKYTGFSLCFMIYYDDVRVLERLLHDMVCELILVLITISTFGACIQCESSFLVWCFSNISIHFFLIIKIRSGS